MRFRKPKLNFLLDEGVPNTVGRVLQEARHRVDYGNQGALFARGSADHVVAFVALQNDRILVALDGDMRVLARGLGVGGAYYRRLSLLKLSCPEATAAGRVREALSLIEHEWVVNEQAGTRRLFVEVSNSFIRTNR